MDGEQEERDAAGVGTPNGDVTSRFRAALHADLEAFPDTGPTTAAEWATRLHPWIQMCGATDVRCQARFSWVFARRSDARRTAVVRADHLLWRIPDFGSQLDNGHDPSCSVDSRGRKARKGHLGVPSDARFSWVATQR